MINESSDKELEEYYHKCIMTLESAKTQKESNEILIKQCLGYTNSMLNMLKPRENNNVYILMEKLENDEVKRCQDYLEL